MIISATDLPPACLIDPEKLEDSRGFFARSFCAESFARHGLPTDFVQASISFTTRRGTLRGLHYQAPPGAEGKLIRCTRGAVFDVLLDLRPDSPGFRHWRGFELTQDNRRAIYIPPGFAHGFQTLTDDAELFYQMTAPHRPDLACGVRWNDPAFGIIWPLPDPILSERDASYADFTAWS